MSAATESYMLIFRDTAPETYESMSPRQRETCLREWNRWHDDIAAAGRLHHGHPLAPGGRLISAAEEGRPLDGPFAEAKEAIGGYFLIAAKSLDEATQIARRCPNLQHGMTVEVRPVSGACHLAKSIGWETMREPRGA